MQKHVSPLTISNSVLMFAVLSLIHSVPMVIDNASGWLLVVGIAILVLTTILSCISLSVSVYTIRKKNLQRGDEFTTSVINKAGNNCFYLTLAISVLLITVLRLVSVFSGMPIEGFLDVRAALSFFVGILMTSAILFISQLFYYLKKGSV